MQQMSMACINDCTTRKHYKTCIKIFPKPDIRFLFQVKTRPDANKGCFKLIFSTVALKNIQPRA